MACCGLTCSKVFVVLFNIFFWISGCALVALGGLLLWSDTYKSYFMLAMHQCFERPETEWLNEVLLYSALSIIGLGGFIIFFGFFGCCGSCQESKCMLGIYIFLLVLISLLEIAVALVAAYYWHWYPASAINRKMVDQIKDHYGQPGNDTFSEALNFTQYHEECCGIASPDDYGRSAWQQRSMSTQNRINNTLIIRPLTCCKLRTDYENDPWKKPDVENLQLCQRSNPNEAGSFLHTEGCSKKIEDWYKFNLMILAAALAGIVLIQILTVVFSVCEIRNIPEYEEGYA